MDKRFKNLDKELKFEPNKAQIDSFFNEFDNIVLDNAFVEANSRTQYAYAPIYWSNFKNQESELIQDHNFAEASKNYNATYNPAFWDQAQEALVTEGLHYQYKPSYWNEAEKLLVEADKKSFFQRWMMAAMSLLIIGLISGSFINSSAFNFKKQDLNTAELSVDKLTFDKNLRFNYLEGIKQNLPVLTKKRNGSKALNRTLNSKPIKPLTEVINNTIQNTTGNNLVASNILKKSIDENIEDSKRENLNIDNITAPSMFNQKSLPKIITQNINKISIAPKSHIPFKFSSDKPKALLPVGIRPKKPVNPFQMALILQSGVGNALISENLNHRVSADLGIEFSLKKLNFSFTSGMDYENLNNYTNRTNLVDYNRSGRINHLWYAYEFKNIIKWQNSVFIGYQISKRFSIMTGLSYDTYFTSKLKVMESVNDDLSESPHVWGKNDLFNNHDIQINGRIEYRILPQFSIIASAEIGLLEKIANDLNQSLKNKGLLLGIKYLPFKK